ncbi:DUF6531 domain-containing protein [Streptomyces profundus]|uniref:DUF6531 domain-containing protein n=1 Tax=Streptomyces profundus TaxID=2867410 RepID=UPI001D16AE52|nr:DUF6531 domain-containing protein [Streptomyces sp. MA3_2.13]UED86106.1 DUF6531 domain-containing protein [Streptomyces sp. MA3_2.13]
MARPADWSPLDLDSDPTPGDPGEVRELADELQEFADEVGEALGTIRGMASERAMLEWAGLSADTFRAEFESVPGNLSKLEESYALCSQALQGYWPQLETAQGMADRALDRAISARADLTSARFALEDAQDWVGRAGDEAERLREEGRRENVEPPDESTVRAAARDQQAAASAAGAAEARVADAEQRLDAARQLALDAREMRAEAARICAQGVDEASDAGIQNKKWWEKLIEWLSDAWDTLVSICKVIVAVLAVVAMIIGGPLALVVLVAAVVVLADTLVKFAQGKAGLLDVAFAALDCIPGMKGLTTLGGLARGIKGLATTGIKGLKQGALKLGRIGRGEGIPINARNACGDPVDVATGELLMSAVDVELPGVLPLVIERHHISSYRAGGWFGSSWASTLDQRLILEEHGARLLTADGMTLLYPRPIVDEPVLPVEGPRWTLSWDGQPGSPLTVDQRDGPLLHFAPVPGRPGSELPLVAITDRHDNRVQFAYDETGAPTDIHHSGGYHLGVATEGGRVTELRLLSHPERPVVMAYGYDAAGLLHEIRQADGPPLRFAYDAHARMSRWEDRNGYWYSYEYDERGRCVFTTGTDRVLEYRYAYDPENLRTDVTDSLGQRTRYQFNDCFQLVAQTDPSGHTTGQSWDRYDRSLTRTDPLGRVTRLGYDAAGHLAELVRPDGLATRLTHNELGLVTEITQADGATWRQAYDAAGDLVVLQDPAGHRTRYGYDAHGGLAEVTDPSGDTTRIRSDAAGLPLVVNGPDGEVTRYERDAFGRVTTVTDPSGAMTRFAWSPAGQLLRQTDPLGGSRSWSYDAEGNCRTTTDETGATTTVDYGAFDLPTRRTGPDGVAYAIERDTELRLTGVVDPLGRVWRYDYDPNGRLLAQTDFDGRVTTYRRDAAGQLVERVNPAGQSVRYRYDALGRVAESAASDGGVTTFTRDPLGRVVAAESPGTVLTRAYDVRGDWLSETVNGRTLTVARDALGQVVERTTPAGVHSAWAYAGFATPTALTVDGRTVAFSRTAHGRGVARTYGGQLTVSVALDAAGRPTDQLVTGPAGRDIARHSYSYRADHHLTGLTGPGGPTEFTLDPRGRVTAVDGPAGEERYAYTETGDQAEAGWPRGEPASAGPRSYTGTLLTDAGRTHYTYDAAGRVVARRRKNLSKKPDTWAYTWDADDRLTSVTTPDGTVWRYRYDAFGRRTAKERLGQDGRTPVELTDFTWQDTNLVEQTATGGDARGPSTLTWEHEGTTPLLQLESAGHSAAQQEVDRRFHAIVSDLVGRPTLLIDERDEQWETAWESRTTLWGAPLPGGPDGTDTPLRFPGQYADEETGWHYNHHRHYDPETGRYVTADPLGLAPAENPRVYVHNPLTWSDPLGLAPHSALITGFRLQTLHRLSRRMLVDGSGNVSIAGRQHLYVNLSNDIRHTLNFRGGQGEIVSFQLRQSFLDRVRSTAIPQRNPGNYTPEQWKQMKQTHPEISDPTKGDDLYGLPGSMLDEFQDAIIPGSGKIIKNGSS